MALGQYIVTTRKNIASSGTGEMLVNNPSNNDFQAKIKTLIFGSETLTDVDCLKNVTVDSSGTSKTPQNLEITVNNTSSIEVETGGTYSGGTTFFSGVIYPNCREPVGGTINTEREDMILYPGNNLLIKVTNKGASTGRTTLELVYKEMKY